MTSSHNPYIKTVFPNGTRLILVPMEGVESIATSVMVNVGSRLETTKTNGVSHFLEHLVFKGTKKYPSMEDVMFIERLGGLQNAYTDIDVTSYHNKVMASDWKEALDINTELSLHPLLEEQYIEKERNVILEEMKRYEDEPAAKVGEVFHEMLYPGTKLGMRIIGTEKSLREADSTSLQTYHDTWYAPERTVVVIAGKVAGQEEAMKKQVSDWFTMVPQKKTDAEETVRDTQSEPAVSVLTKPDAQQAHLTMGFRIFNRKSEDRFAWNVFNLLFGVSFTSRLFQEIREKRGLCYAIKSGADTWQDVGYWSIYAGVATDKVGEAVKAICGECSQVVEKGVTEEEVKVAKKRLLTMLTFKIEDPEFMGEYYGRQELYHLPILSMADYRRKIEAVTKEDINALVRTYIIQNTVNLAVVWNKPEDENMRDLLKI